jgi:hypothetical protein
MGVTPEMLAADAALHTRPTCPLRTAIFLAALAGDVSPGERVRDYRADEVADRISAILKC